MADETELDINIKGNASGVEGASKKATVAVGTVSAEAKQLDAAFRRLKSSIDPAFAATEKYNKALTDNKRLLDAGRISQDEYAAGARAAKAALDSQLSSINQNSAAQRAAAAAQRESSRQAAAQEKADAADAARVARQAAQEKRAAEVAASKEAAAAEREAKAEARQAAREAADVAKQMAREKLAAERSASQEAAEAERQAKASVRQSIKEAAETARTAAQEKRQADRIATDASRDLARQVRDQARAEREASDAVRELRGSIDPAYAAQERYNETMRRATSLLMQNKLQQGEFTIIQKQAASQMDVNTRSMGRMNSVNVQMGYQMQDVVASWSSGISPLIILAQQGGQTASALSMMGGTVGRVASFFAGPWGAAIIGATLLLGMFMKTNKEAEKATKDATNAEDLRKMKLQELTQALKDYNKEQREANRNNFSQRQEKLTGAFTQLDEANKRVTTLQRKLSDAKKHLEDLLDNPSGDATDAALLGATAQVNRLTRDLQSAQAAARSAQGSVSQARLSQLQAQAEAQADDREAIRLKYEEEQAGIQRSYQSQINAANRINDVKQRTAAIARIELNTQNELAAAKKKEKDAEEALAKQKSDEKKAPAVAARAAREAAKEAKDDLKDKIEGYTYEQALAGENFEEILRLQDLKIAATKKFYGEDSKEALQAQRERVAQEKQYQAQLLQIQQQGIEARLNNDEAGATARSEVDKTKVEQKGDTTSFNQSVGLITDETANAQRAAQLQEAYQLEVSFENKLYELRLKALQDRLALENLPVRQKAEINQQIQTLEAQHNQRLLVMDAQNVRQTNLITQQGATLIANKWRSVANTISQSLSSSFQGIWTKTLTWQQAMFNLADRLVYKFVDMGMKLVEDWIVKQALKLGVTQAAQTAEVATVAAAETAKTGATTVGTAARVGVTAAGTAATTSMTIGGALASIAADAARAAAGAYAAIAGIPVVGPFLAPAAAGAALIAVMGLGARIASARGGQWQVPGDGQMTELHKDEMVLPAWAAKPLRANLSAPSSAGMMGRAAAAGSAARTSTANDNSTLGGSGDTHMWSIQAMDAKSFQKFLEDNPRALQAAMRKQIRTNLGKGG